MPIICICMFIKPYTDIVFTLEAVRVCLMCNLKCLHWPNTTKKVQPGLDNILAYDNPTSIKKKKN